MCTVLLPPGVNPIAVKYNNNNNNNINNTTLPLYIIITPTNFDISVILREFKNVGSLPHVSIFLCHPQGVSKMLVHSYMLRHFCVNFTEFKKFWFIPMFRHFRAILREIKTFSDDQIIFLSNPFMVL
jgi:hypothetical protein